MNESIAWLILVNLDREKTSYALHFDIKAMTEYDTLITRIKLAEEFRVNILEVFLDSMLVVNHVTGAFQAKSERLTKYVQFSKRLLGQFKCVHITQVARTKNTEADTLARLAPGIDRDEGMLVPVKKLLAPSI